MGKFLRDIQNAARCKLLYLEDAEDLLAPPSNRLEKLSGNRNGQYSIRINDQWHICFSWQVNGAYEVESKDPQPRSKPL